MNSSLSKIPSIKTLAELKMQRVIQVCQDNLYYCPFCKSLAVHRLNGSTFGCQDCRGDAFTRETYLQFNKDGKPYYKNGTIDQFFIDSCIVDILEVLTNRGFSNREIHEITLFSRSKINKLFRDYFTTKSINLHKSEFLEKQLSVDPDIANHLSDQDNINTCIHQALLFGCTYTNITELFHIKRDRITKYLKRVNLEKDEDLLDMIFINKNIRKIRVVDDLVTVHTTIRKKIKIYSYQLELALGIRLNTLTPSHKHFFF